MRDRSFWSVQTGSEYPLEGRYRTESSPSGLRSWSGTFSGGVDLGNLAGEQLTLRLPDGREGTVLVNNVTLSAVPGGSRARGEFMGNGPAPGEG